MKTITDLYDSYKASQDYLNETLGLLCRLTGNKIDLPDLDNTLNKMSNELMNLNEAASKVFELCGLIFQKRKKRQLDDPGPSFLFSKTIPLA